ncbi:MAG: KH domain-containing protein [Chloroflexota bacterium]
MRELVEYIAKSLVENPDQVRINQVQGEQSVILELRVAPGDRGKVIGKQGRIARATRVLLKAAAAKEGKRGVLEII